MDSPSEPNYEQVDKQNEAGITQIAPKKVRKPRPRSAPKKTMKKMDADVIDDGAGVGFVSNPTKPKRRASREALITKADYNSDTNTQTADRKPKESRTTGHGKTDLLDRPDTQEPRASLKIVHDTNADNQQRPETAPETPKPSAVNKLKGLFSRFQKSDKKPTQTESDSQRLIPKESETMEPNPAVTSTPHKPQAPRRLSRSQSAGQQTPRLSQNADGQDADGLRNADQTDAAGADIDADNAGAVDGDGDGDDGSVHESLIERPRQAMNMDLPHSSEIPPSHNMSSQARVLAEPPKLFGDKGPEDFVDHCISIKVHKTDPLRPHPFLEHPSVRIHVINMFTGNYLEKQDPKKSVVSQFESGTKLLPSGNEAAPYPYILPLQTGISTISDRKDFRPSWDEEILVDEDYLFLVKPEVVLLFEIIDFSTKKPPEKTVSPDGYYRICWGFLKIIGSTGVANTEKPIRIQLYHHPGQSIYSRFKIPPIYQLVFDKIKRKEYPSTLHITISGKRRPEREAFQGIRPTNPFQEEIGRLTYDEIMEQHKGQEVVQEKTGDPEVPDELKLFMRWKRLPGQRSKLPNTVMHKFDTASMGCLSIQFSPDGEYLAAGCGDNQTYPVKIFEVLSGELVSKYAGHHDIIHEITWQPNGSEFVTASSDFTAKVWLLKDPRQHAFMTLQHTSFVYAAQYHPTARSPRVIATGAFDAMVRLWNRDDGTLLFEMPSHRNYINSVLFEKEGQKMYTADGGGVIRVWSKKQSTGTNFEGYECLRSIYPPEKSTDAITTLKLHPTGRRMLVQSQNNQIRSVELKSYATIGVYMGSICVKRSIKSCYSSDGRYVLSGSEDGKIYAWDTDSTVIENMTCDPKYTHPIYDVSWHPYGDIIAVCSFGSPQPIYLFRYEKKNDEEKEEAPSGIVDFQERVRVRRMEFEREMKNRIEDMLASAREELHDYQRMRHQRLPLQSVNYSATELAERRKKRLERKDGMAKLESGAGNEHNKRDMAVGTDDLNDPNVSSIEAPAPIESIQAEASPEKERPKPKPRRLKQSEIDTKGRRPVRKNFASDEERLEFQKRFGGSLNEAGSGTDENAAGAFAPSDHAVEMRNYEDVLEIRTSKVGFPPVQENVAKGSKRPHSVKNPIAGSKRDPSRVDLEANDM